MTIPVEYISSNSDDAFEYENGSVAYSTSANIRMGNRSGSSFGKTYTGLRFSSIPIPQGATITSAVIKVVPYYASPATNTSTATVRLKIYAEAVDNSTFFSNTKDDIINRTATSAQVDWDIAANWSTNVTKTSVDIFSYKK